MGTIGIIPNTEVIDIVDDLNEKDEFLLHSFIDVLKAFNTAFTMLRI